MCGFVVWADRQHTFQALTLTFRGFGERRHPQPGGFVVRIDAQRLREEHPSARLITRPDGRDDVGNDAMKVG